MTEHELLVDGRVLDDQHPGVRDFWVPVLRAWAADGGRGLVAYRREPAPVAALVEAGFEPVELAGAVTNPLAASAARRLVRATGVGVTLSPLYLTLDGAPRNLATLFDLTGRTHPRTLASRLLWEVAMRRVLRRATGIVCGTHSAAAECARSFPRARGRIAVVSPVVPGRPEPRRDVLARYDLETPYALVVASHRPHKRLALLTRAWLTAASGLTLVIVGAGTEALGRPPIVRGLGFLSGEMIGALLASASCLISASLAEGFGLPVLAAMAAGVPVLATHLDALREVAGDGALWHEPEDLPGLVATAKEVAADPTMVADRVARGRERAAQYTAARAARELAALIH